MKKLLTSILILAVIGAQAQSPVFTKIDIDIDARFVGSTIYPLAEMNGKVMLAVRTNAYGQELWITDGTNAGTTLVKDIFQGPVDGFSFLGSIAYNGKFYFVAEDSTHGKELWVSDGTAAGTQMVLDIYPGNNSAFYFTAPMFIYNGKIYFAANDGTNGKEIWMSDGTAAGTQMLKDINPGTASAISYGHDMQEYNGKLFFNAYDNTTGNEVWSTDGTTAGTQLLKDIYPGTNNSSPQHFTKFRNEMYFVASNTAGRELWHTDGTTAGTAMLKDINTAGNGIGNSCNIAVLNNKLYFVGNDAANGIELWSTDGTPAGTQIVKDIYPGMTSSNIPWLAVCGNKLYFAADQPGSGMEPWVSDGTAGGTKLLKELYAGATSSDPKNFQQYKNYVYFSALQNNGVNQLWQTDGTATNTKTVAPAGSTATDPLFSDSFLLYAAKDSSMYFHANYSGTGEELWVMKDTTKDKTGITAIGRIVDLHIAPNPAHHNFTIKTTTAFTVGSITLTDATGRVVMTEKLYNNQQTISLQGIAPGIYIADVWLDDKRSTQKLVVE